MNRTHDLCLSGARFRPGSASGVERAAGIRDEIDPHALLLPAAQANGYIAKYGEWAARQTIADGIAYARPRPDPASWDPSRPRVWRVRGGHLKVEVSL